MTPYQVLKEAIQAVPAVKYALGIAGIAAVVSVVVGFGSDLRIALFGTIITIFLMVILVIFARLTSLATPVFHLPILVLTWFSLTMLMATSTLLVTSVFFSWPRDLSRWLSNGSASSDQPNVNPSAAKGVPVGLHRPGSLESPASTSKSPPMPAGTQGITAHAAEARVIWGERQMAEDDIPHDREVIYRARLENGMSRITYENPYLDRVRQGGLIEGVNYLGAPFKWRFPELSVKVVNNTAHTMVLSEARLDVVSSRLIGDPVLMVESFSVDKLVIRNEGWDDVVSPSVEFTVTEPQSEDAVQLFAPVTHTVSLQNFSAITEVPLAPYLPERLRGMSAVAVQGRIRYGQPPHQHVVAFQTHVSLQVRAAVGIPPSHYYDVRLKAGEAEVTEQISLAQEIKPGASDHFILRLGTDKSSQYHLKLSFRTATGDLFSGGDVRIDIFVPRTSGKLLQTAR